MTSIAEVIARVHYERFADPTDADWPALSADIQAERIERISTGLASIEAAGYVVVPREPTEAMVDAAHDALAQAANNIEPGEVVDLREGWRAMVEAAPK